MELANYQRDDTHQTLREGLDEYFTTNPGLTRLEPGDPGAELFLPHDACHVFFGLGTSLMEEALADTWTMFGTNVGIRRYLGYTKYAKMLNPASITKALGWWPVLREFARSIPYTWRAYRAAKRMHERWDFSGYEQYLDISLTELRSRFGVHLIVVPESSRDVSSVRGPAVQQTVTMPQS